MNQRKFKEWSEQLSREADAAIRRQRLHQKRDIEKWAQEVAASLPDKDPE